MPKTTAPLLSFGATGQIAKSMVYASWKGVPYVRRYTVPANPRTEKQVANRDVWQMINQAWLYAPAPMTAAFNAFATGKPLTGRNKFFSDNQTLFGVHPKPADNEGFVMSPGNGGGLPAANLLVTPGDTELVVSADLPDVPTGWTLVSAHAACLETQSPTDPFPGAWFSASDAVTPEDVTITGLANGTEYTVGYWLEWLKPDGKTAYSISLSGTGTPAM